MARTLSVKIPVATLIADIEASIAKIDSDVENYKSIREQYLADVKKYNEEVIAKAVSILTKPENIGLDRSSVVYITTNYRGGVQVEFNNDLADFPERPSEPKLPNEKTYFGREYTTRKELLEKNLRILKMTLQEEVSASSYSSVIDLI